MIDDGKPARTGRDVADECRERMKLARDSEDENRAAGLDDLRFAAGDQWPAESKAQRTLERRPCLTINKTDTFCRSIENNMRQQRPRIKVHAISGGADKMVADVIEGMIRHIEINSNADLAYDTAGHYQVRMGWGYWRVIAKYTDSDSFDQELCVERIRNPFSVYMDPSSISPDGSDANWCVITQAIRREEFLRDYPNADPMDYPNLGAGDDKAQWANKKEVIVAEYIRFVDKSEKLFHLSDGRKVFKSDMPSAETLQAAGVEIVNQRDSIRRQLKWSKCTGVEELDKRELPGKYLPVVPAYGAELIVDGKCVRFGAVRQAMDPQRMYNYWRTQETEFVALAPKAPWIMVEGQDEGHENEWNTANVSSYSSLKFKAMSDETGAQYPPPQRQQPQAIPAASVNAAMGASEDMKAVFGMFDPALGAPGQETSGTMVRQRQQQSDLSNFHFYDNLTRSIRQTGKILLDLIPHYYDTERVMRIIGEDGQPKTLTINQKQRDSFGAVLKVLNDVTVGCYDVVMDTGPGYQTRRQEGAEMMIETLKALPQVGQVAGDLIVRQMDYPGSNDIADRLEATNPIAMAEKKLPDDMPPEAKSLIANLQGAVQQMQQHIQQLELEKKAKVWGDAQWQDMEMQKTHLQEQGANQREAVKAMAKLYDTDTKADAGMKSEHFRAQLEILLKQMEAENQPTTVQ